MEEWKKVEGHPNYSVSCLGNVRNDKTGRILKLQLRSGYPSAMLLGKQKQIHRLVATAFCDNENGYNIVDHIDQNKTNNHYLNLRWTTTANNTRNTKKREGCSSRYLGVSYNIKNKKWQSRIRIEKLFHLGYFETQEEARDAFRNAVEEHNLQDFYPLDDAEESLENNINP